METEKHESYMLHDEIINRHGNRSALEFKSFCHKWINYQDYPDLVMKGNLTDGFIRFALLASPQISNSLIIPPKWSIICILRVRSGAWNFHASKFRELFEKFKTNDREWKLYASTPSCLIWKTQKTWRPVGEVPPRENRKEKQVSFPRQCILTGTWLRGLPRLRDKKINSQLRIIINEQSSWKWLIQNNIDSSNTVSCWARVER